MSHKSYGGGDSGFERKLIKTGLHLAICYSFIDLGTQPEDYQGKVTNIPKIQIGWELPNLKEPYTDKDGNEKEYVCVIYMEYLDSLNEKANLRKHLVGWRGRDFTVGELKGFEMKNILGVPCNLNIIHKMPKSGKSYEKIDSISSVAKETEIPELTRKIRFLSFQETPYDENLLNSLPEFIQNKIRQSPEYAQFVKGEEPETEESEQPEKTQAEITAANDEGTPF